MTIDQARRLQAVARWHRRCALFVLLWLALLATSGIFINHANDWGLDRKALWPALQSWIYGVEPADSRFCDGIQLPDIECFTIFDRLELPGGALLLEPHSLYLVDPRGEILEQVPVSQLGLVSLEAGKTIGDQVFLRGAGQSIVTDPDLLDIRQATASELDSVQAYPWRKAESETVQITWERFFLDFHAARFLGSFSQLFNDLVAGLILLLALSGLLLHKTKGRKA